MHNGNRREQNENMDLPEAIDETAERKLIRQGTKRSLDKLALAFMNEAVIYCRHCSRGGLSETELVSMCWIALRQAAENYRRRKSNGIGFFAFAKQYLRGQISKEFKRFEVVRNGGTPFEFVEDFKVERRQPSDDYEYISREFLRPIVKPVCEPDHRNLEAKELLRGIQPAIFKALNDLERAILILRYESDFSFGEIGERLGYSRQHIQNLHKRSLRKLRSALEPKKSQLM